MSDCMIIRRGGGGQGFDPNGAVLKVVTSTGCTVAVTNSSAGYSKTHQQANGYPRSNDANVTEHFFSIPASAFGTLTVVSTNTYGNNTKSLTVDTAGKVYELYCGGTNIILDGTFGLQSGYTWVPETGTGPNSEYNERDKRIEWITSYSYSYGHLAPPDGIPITAYNTLKVTWDAELAGYSSRLSDKDNIVLCEITELGTATAQITNKHYPGATFYARYFSYISEIVLT